MKRITTLAVLITAFCFVTKADPTNFLTFDGTQYVDIPTTDDLSMTTDESLTVSFWVKPVSGNSGTRVISNRDNYGNSTGSLDAFCMTNNNIEGNVALMFIPESTASNQTKPMDSWFGGNGVNGWSHYVAVFDRTTGEVHAYSNGTIVSAVEGRSITSDQVINTTAPTLLGAGESLTGSITNYFSGEIANVRFYKAPLTAAQVAEDMSAATYADLSNDLKTSCVAAYDLTDNYTSLTLTDATGRGNNGTLVNYDAPVVDVPARTITVSASPAEGGVVTGAVEGSTTNQTITATANDGYQFVNWTVNDVEVSTDATYTDITESDKDYVANFMAAYCTNVTTNSSTYARTLTSFTFDCDEYSGTVSVNQTSGGTTYFDLTSTTLTVVAGETITPSASFSGWWIHGYIYIDFGADGIFSVDLNDEGVPSDDSDLRAFSCYYAPGSTTTYIDSNGESASNESDTPTYMPTFTVPAGTPAGTYNARYKVDWLSTDPCGSTGFGTTGGTMVDFKIEVVAPVVQTYTIGARVSTFNGSANVNGDATITVDEGTEITFYATPNSGYEFVRWAKGSGDGDEVSTEATYTTTATEDITLYAVFQVAAVVEDKDITGDTTETDDAAYLDVTIEGTNNWTIANYAVTAESLTLTIAEDGSTPQIIVGKTGSLTVDEIAISRSIAAEFNAIMSLPFAFNLADITVNDAAAEYGTNILLYTYNAAKRAANSTQGMTATGWETITSGTIAANQGFAIAVHSGNGDTQTVTFKATNVTFTGEDKTINLDRHASTVNEGADADWNFYGNPYAQHVDKSTGYSLYIYDAANNTYSESSSAESAAYIAYAGAFAQSGDDFTSIAFSTTSTVYYTSAIEIESSIKLTINGDEDVAKMFVVDGSSAEYVTNEDAMYFANNNSSISQIYFVDQNGSSIASTVVPAIESTSLTYIAATAGTQSIAMATDVTDTALYLQDSVTGQSILMTDGAIYEFESAAGTVSNRFTLVAVGEVTGIESATSSDVKVVASSSAITVIGAEIGAEVAVYSVSGTVLYSGVITSSTETISISATGVLIVKVGSEVVKVVK